MEKLKSLSKGRKILLGTSLLMLACVLFCWLFRFCVDNYVFGDFAETLGFCLVKNPYSGYGMTSIYPPFAFLPFYPFALICKKPITQALAHEITFNQLISHPMYLLSYFLFYAICISTIMLISAKMTKFKGWKLFSLLICVFCFSPIMFCFFRGNNIIFAVIFLLLFFWLYDSDKKLLREFANISLACAIGVKLFPALVLLYFIKDRRWLDMLKTLLYAVVILVVPFIFIEGTFSNISTILSTFTQFSGEADRSLSLTNISLDSFASKFCYILNLCFKFNTAPLQSILSKLLRFGLIIMTVICMILSKHNKHKFKTASLCLLTYQLFQGVSYAYAVSSLIVAVIFYIMQFNELSKSDKIFYGMCYFIIGFPISALINCFVLSQITLIVLCFKLIIDIIKEYKTNKVVKTNTQQIKENI